VTKSKTETVAGAEEKPSSVPKAEIAPAATAKPSLKPESEAASETKTKLSPKGKPEVAPKTAEKPLPEGAAGGAGMEEGLELFGAGAKDKQPPQETEEERGLKQSLTQLIGKLGNAIASFASDVTTLDITTYYNTDVEGYTFKDGKFTGPEQPTPRAATYIKLDGDMVVVVPKADAELWAIHQEMVRMAQENRARLIEIAINAATSIVKVIG
jgi:hypothetical protein